MRIYETYIYPLSMSNKVLFPAPEGPIIAVNSPARNSPFNPFSKHLSPAEKWGTQNILYMHMSIGGDYNMRIWWIGKTYRVAIILLSPNTIYY